MLKFNPENYLSFTTNNEQKLQASFIISNPSTNCSAPFKVKSTKPELFRVRPHVGVIMPLQQVQVFISTVFKGSPEMARQIAHEHKFRIEYAMLDKAPYSIADAISKITDANKQIHKLYINAPTPRGQLRQDISDNKSSLSNRISYRTARDENEDHTVHRFQEREMGAQEKFEQLKGQIDKLEKQRSEVIMASKPTKRVNLLTAVLILLFMIILGNLTGKMLFPHKAKTPRTRKQREYKYWGLQKLWAGDEPEIEQVPWWKFWS